MNALAPIVIVLAALGAPPASELQQTVREPDVVMLDQVPGCYGAVRFDHTLHVGMSSMGSACNYCHHTDTYQPCRECHDSTSTVLETEKLGLRGAYHRQCLSCHKDWAHENACGFCHNPSSSRRRTLENPARSRRAAHASAQFSYVYETAHENMPIVTFHHEDHARVFGLKCTDCHEGNSCGQCHGPSAARPTVNRQETCYRCHAETRCVTCHNRGEQEPFNHAVNAKWLLRPGHDDLACNQCHEDHAAPSRPDSEKCRSCHADQAGGFFDHSVTGVVLKGDHALFSCLECHANPGSARLASCNACHIDRPITGYRAVGRELD
ncbi:MAG: hypothetical protein GIKADHBN_00701 [Phycisphaerales bacterium]|nr:hypothetical protein [Phycisphaerales bacterium]